MIKKFLFWFLLCGAVNAQIFGTSPGGKNTNVQYNKKSRFGGDSTFIFNDSTKTLRVRNLIVDSTATGSFSSSVTTSKIFALNNPTASLDRGIWRVPDNITILKVWGFCTGGTNLVGHLSVYDSTGTTLVRSLDTTDITFITSMTIDTVFATATVVAGQVLGVGVTSVSGPVTFCPVGFDYQLTQ